MKQKFQLQKKEASTYQSCRGWSQRWWTRWKRSCRRVEEEGCCPICCCGKLCVVVRGSPTDTFSSSWKNPLLFPTYVGKFDFDMAEMI
ncbi:unnamed protein product [Lactuca virosa]|uniref:Uncharacterized protein n=1 Tax=Lactuca virosa TaxID=75947 RepID=A0AAU9M8B0_9ASTR|nr:unnamed protein product [Lactuca virosa]